MPDDRFALLPFGVEGHLSEFCPDATRLLTVFALELVGDPEQRAVEGGAVVAGQVHDARLDDEPA